jgi:hypothetical protein
MGTQACTAACSERAIKQAEGWQAVISVKASTQAPQVMIF